jgi:hypothetical protein
MRSLESVCQEKVVHSCVGVRRELWWLQHRDSWETRGKATMLLEAVTRALVKTQLIERVFVNLVLNLWVP